MNAAPSDSSDTTPVVHVGGSDLVMLSHALTAAGRVHDAALAQWAADLRLVGPHLATRTPELVEALESLAPLDPQAALAGARAAAASLVDGDVPVLSLLGPTWHLNARSTAATRPDDGAPADAVQLPEDVERAFEATLADSAERAGDTRQVSVGVRRALLRHRAAKHRRMEPTALARGVLEPYEHQVFDALLEAAT